VLDCTGSYEIPLWLGDGGIPAPGERALGSRILRRLPDFDGDPSRWQGRSVLLAGAGHSAQTAAAALARLADEALAGGRLPPRVVWVLRRASPQITAQVDDPLPERGALHARAIELIGGAHPALETRLGASIESLRPSAPSADRIRVRLRLRGGDGNGEQQRYEELEVDDVLALVGSTGERELYAELHVHECYATCGPIRLAAKLLGEGGSDCMSQSAGGIEALENPEPGFFVVGSKSYGRTSTFLLRVGYEQVGLVMEAVARGSRAIS
jgi:hypothetical protein